jgi:hypothetical protein
MSLYKTKLKMTQNLFGLIQVTRTALYDLPGKSQIDLKSLMAKPSFHILWNFAQVNLIDLLIVVNLCY